MILRRSLALPVAGLLLTAMSCPRSRPESIILVAPPDSLWLDATRLEYAANVTIDGTDTTAGTVQLAPAPAGRWIRPLDSWTHSFSVRDTTAGADLLWTFQGTWSIESWPAGADSTVGLRGSGSIEVTGGGTARGRAFDAAADGRWSASLTRSSGGISVTSYEDSVGGRLALASGTSVPFTIQRSSAETQ